MIYSTSELRRLIKDQVALSYGQIARMTGLSETMINKFANGHTNFSAENLEIVSNVIRDYQRGKIEAPKVRRGRPPKRLIQ